MPAPNAQEKHWGDHTCEQAIESRHGTDSIIKPWCNYVISLESDDNTRLAWKPGAGLLEVSEVNLLLTHPPATCILINPYHVLDLMQ